MESIVTAHEGALLRYATGILNDSHAAQDVVQNTFIKLFKLWKPGAKPSDSLRAWLYRVTHNEAVDYIRRQQRINLLHSRHAEEAAAASDPRPGMAEKMELVMAGIRRLDAPEQQVLLLRLQEGLSYQEISKVTGRSEGNVGCILHHAVKKLGRIVSKESPSGGGGGL